jgi:hypothetical protein
MPSDLQRVARGLVECLDQVPEVVAHLQRTAARCRENATVVIAVSGGRATMAAQQLDAAARACEEAAHYLSMAPPKTRAWAERLIGVQLEGSRQADQRSIERNPLTTGGPGSNKDERASRGDDRQSESRDEERRTDNETADGDRTPEPDPGSGLVDGGDTPEPPSVGGEVPERPNPAPFLEHIFRRLPERPGGRGPTSGILTRTDGRGPIHLVSGTRGPGRGSPGLAGDYARLSVSQDHVEGHAAALMRRLGAPKEATLYLNNQPCGGEYGCDETLEAQLPRGTKLTIFWPGDHKVYRGTGEGMA